MTALDHKAPRHWLVNRCMHGCHLWNWMHELTHTRMTAKCLDACNGKCRILRVVELQTARNRILFLGVEYFRQVAILQFAKVYKILLHARRVLLTSHLDGVSHYRKKMDICSLNSNGAWFDHPWPRLNVIYTQSSPSDLENIWMCRVCFDFSEKFLPINYDYTVNQSCRRSDFCHFSDRMQWHKISLFTLCISALLHLMRSNLNFTAFPCSEWLAPQPISKGCVLFVFRKNTGLGLQVYAHTVHPHTRSSDSR